MFLLSCRKQIPAELNLISFLRVQNVRLTRTSVGCLGCFCATGSSHSDVDFLSGRGTHLFLLNTSKRKIKLNAIPQIPVQASFTEGYKWFHNCYMSTFIAVKLYSHITATCRETFITPGKDK